MLDVWCQAEVRLLVVECFPYPLSGLSSQVPNFRLQASGFPSQVSAFRFSLLNGARCQWRCHRYALSGFSFQVAGRRSQVSAFKFLIVALRKEWQVLLALVLPGNQLVGPPGVIYFSLFSVSAGATLMLTPSFLSSSSRRCSPSS